VTLVRLPCTLARRAPAIFLARLLIFFEKPTNQPNKVRSLEISRRQKGLHKIATHKVFTDTATPSKKTSNHRKEQVIFAIKTPTKTQLVEYFFKSYKKSNSSTPMVRRRLVCCQSFTKIQVIFANSWDRKF